MHKFLRAIGFSRELNRNEQRKLMEYCIQNAESRNFVSVNDDGLVGEYFKSFSPEFGICVRGELEDEIDISFDYYFPYLKSNLISTTEDVCIEEKGEKLCFSGLCDDLRIGVSLIFYLQNMVFYLKQSRAKSWAGRPTTLSLAGLSVNGRIIMPLSKKAADVSRAKQRIKNRNLLLARARKGNEEAMENLSMDDLDIYTAVSEKIMKEDLYSIVDTCFMPHGLESDHYMVIGEITDYHVAENSYTNEEVVILQLLCNDLSFDVCINRKDLLGEPAVGRRFKGVVWMQGYLDYIGPPEELPFP